MLTVALCKVGCYRIFFGCMCVDHQLYLFCWESYGINISYNYCIFYVTVLFNRVLKTVIEMFILGELGKLLMNRLFVSSCSGAWFTLSV
jgi:hypothetical protein